VFLCTAVPCMKGCTCMCCLSKWFCRRLPFYSVRRIVVPTQWSPPAHLILCDACCSFSRVLKAAEVAAGDAWGPQATHRLLLSVSSGQRRASVWKSSFLPPADASYAITEEGVVDAQPGA
jgi:hypothetical protein